MSEIQRIKKQIRKEERKFDRSSSRIEKIRIERKANSLQARLDSLMDRQDEDAAVMAV